MFWDRDELETVLALKVLTVYGSLSCNMSGPTGLTFILYEHKSSAVTHGHSSCGPRLLLVEMLPLPPGGLRNTAGPRERSHIWGAP